MDKLECELCGSDRVVESEWEDDAYFCESCGHSFI
jgi:hypothetical protein